MFKWIRAEQIFTPEQVDGQEVLLAGGKILAIGNGLLEMFADTANVDVEVMDAGPGSTLVPGFIDNHVHLIGGGGEGGFHTRVPEIQLTDISICAVTTVIGVLGTDDVTRHLESLLGKVRGLEEEGITAYMLTGSYSLPTPTLTGSIKRDMVLIDKVLGAGEIAISDHRASKASFQALKDAAAGVRLGGLLNGRGGVLQLHVGDDSEGLAPLRRLVEERVLPIRQLLPTHVNRCRSLFQEALEYLQAGGQVDLTAFDFPSDTALSTLDAIEAILEVSPDLRNVTISSDSNGSLPEVDEEGRVIGLRQAKMTVLLENIRSLTETYGWERILPLVTSNPARIFGLTAKGTLRSGAHADLAVFLPNKAEPMHVMARGQWLVRDGEPKVRGTFER